MRETELGQREKAIALYEIYGPLLNEVLRKRFEAYYYEDCSLSEIGEMEGTTRMAIHGSLSKSYRKMTDWERKLGLLRKHIEAARLIDGLKGRLQDDHEALKMLEELEDGI